MFYFYFYFYRDSTPITIKNKNKNKNIKIMESNTGAHDATRSEMRGFHPLRKICHCTCG